MARLTEAEDIHYRKQYTDALNYIIPKLIEEGKTLQTLDPFWDIGFQLLIRVEPYVYNEIPSQDLIVKAMCSATEDGKVECINPSKGILNNIKEGTGIVEDLKIDTDHPTVVRFKFQFPLYFSFRPGDTISYNRSFDQKFHISSIEDDYYVCHIIEGTIMDLDLSKIKQGNTFITSVYNG